MSDKYAERKMGKDIHLLIDRDVRKIIESFDAGEITQHKVLLTYVGKVTGHRVGIENFDPFPWSPTLLVVVNSVSYIEKFGPETFANNMLNIRFVTRCMTGDMWFHVHKYYLDRINKVTTPKYLGK